MSKKCRLYIINTNIHPCDTGIFEDRIARIQLEGRRQFLQKLQLVTGFKEFSFPFLNIYRRNTQGKRQFKGLYRKEKDENILRWDLQYNPRSKEITIGGAIENGRVVNGKLSLSEYISKLLTSSTPIASALGMPLRGILQYLDDDSPLEYDLLPAEMEKIQKIDSLEIQRAYIHKNILLSSSI